MSKSSAKQRVEQLKDWLGWIRFQTSKPKTKQKANQSNDKKTKNT